MEAIILAVCAVCGERKPSQKEASLLGAVSAGVRAAWMLAAGLLDVISDAEKLLFR